MRDAAAMARALELARAHLGRTGDNPSVGCVLVRDGRIIGEGATAAGGRPHAETQALEQAVDGASHARGATAYVTLEPCSHYGRTPPCADALIAAGIARCVIAAIDPDPRVHWRGAARLQAAGVDTVVGLGQSEAESLYADYFASRGGSDTGSEGMSGPVLGEVSDSASPTSER